MRKPSKSNQEDSSEKVLPAGRALERIRYDRTVRGLGDVQQTEKVVLEGPKPAAKRPQGKKRKTRSGKLSRSGA